MHDWTRVEACIFHAFHHNWITELARTLNQGLLPSSYYALPEQQAAGFGPNVLTLQNQPENGVEDKNTSGGISTKPLTRPQTRFSAESEGENFRRKKSSIAIRHVSDDCIVAMIEIISPGNKASRHAFQALVDKMAELLEHRIHLLILDPFPPGLRDPHGIHSALWAEVEDQPFLLPSDKPLTLAAYESDLTTRAYIEPIAVGDLLPEMPLFLEPNCHILAPLEDTYLTAFAALPRRWHKVLEENK